MRLVALKPCSFGGKKFKIGNEVPQELVANPKLQAKMDVLSIFEDDNDIPLEECVAQVGIVKFDVPIHTEEGDIVLTVTNEELTVFTDILQVGAVKTEDKQKISDMIQKIESEDLLIMLSALDGRKFVKDTAEERAKALNLVGGDE